jgi:hypothetical protein
MMKYARLLMAMYCAVPNPQQLPANRIRVLAYEPLYTRGLDPNQLSGVCSNVSSVVARASL